MVKHRILVVVDMQHDFVDGVLGTPEAQAIVPKVQTLIDGLDKDNDCLVFTYDTHYANYLDTPEGKHLPVPHCIAETKGWENVFSEAEFARQTSPFETNILIDLKNTFGSNSLAHLIFVTLMRRWNNVEYKDVQIELCGVCTDICVISNALLLKTQFPDIEVYIHPNACAGVTPELHEAALKVMKSCQIDFLEDE